MRSKNKPVPSRKNGGGALHRFHRVNDLEKRREAAIKAKAAIKRTILICGGTGCLSNGAEGVAQAFRDELKKRKIDMKVELAVKTTGCQGFCERGPLVVFQPGDLMYERVTAEAVPLIVQNTVVDGEVVKRFIHRDLKTKEYIPKFTDIPFYARQTRIVLRNIGTIDPRSLDDYLSVGGFKGLIKALSMKPMEIIDTIEASGLRGRGGGGFPTGKKWRVCAGMKSDKRYLVANGDEGDPGAFMDGYLMEGDPFNVIEGMLIAAYAIGADEGFMYVRLEYPVALKSLQNALDICYDVGLLGEDILGSGFNFNVKICRGGGAFVCGEETALMTSIEGGRGMPRSRPPFPAEKGLWGKPTIINNVETLGTLAPIIEKGADWFSSFGTETSKGTKAFSLVGKVNNTGLIEVPMGMTLREIVEEIGGGAPGNKEVKAVQTGGPSGGTIPARMMDIPVDYESLKSVGSIMGSGGLIVIDTDTCVVDLAKFFLNFTMSESCGKCVPCRVGTRHLHSVLTKITKGEGKPEDLEKIATLGRVIQGGALCGLGNTAPNPALSTLKYFEEEYLAHTRDHRCPAAVCQDLVQFRILPEKCTGCMSCVRVCPTGAITGPRSQPHNIDESKCIKCRACYEICRFDAVAGDAIVITSDTSGNGR
ncbi:MAG: 4Fe-4S binding protein [Candidatus Eisenbacteria bacterium]|uniref:4Fe-4S binding protein n=1 Tax=Eiseniibacteriota bacterium TaxID=2212470 RepID=A0A948W6V8_UNCEI|nr:4Fe-4S binding protein [Candidatus Eisenbacteria bacterium]MBU2691540.1 4Fe-4S binding protein [Candidatus Eisenbacteria bacterium]